MGTLAPCQAKRKRMRTTAWQCLVAGLLLALPAAQIALATRAATLTGAATSGPWGHRRALLEDKKGDKKPYDTCVCVFDFDETLRVISKDGQDHDQPARDGAGIIKACKDNGWGIAVASANDNYGKLEKVLTQRVDNSTFNDRFFNTSAFQYHWYNKTISLEAISRYYDTQPRCMMLFDDADHNRKYADALGVNFVHVRNDTGVSWDDYVQGQKFLYDKCYCAKPQDRTYSSFFQQPPDRNFTGRDKYGRWLSPAPSPPPPPPSPSGSGGSKPPAPPPPPPPPTSPPPPPPRTKSLEEQQETYSDHVDSPAAPKPYAAYSDTQYTQSPDSITGTGSAVVGRGSASGSTIATSGGGGRVTPATGRIVTVTTTTSPSVAAAPVAGGSTSTTAMRPTLTPLSGLGYGASSTSTTVMRPVLPPPSSGLGYGAGSTSTTVMRPVLPPPSSVLGYGAAGATVSGVPAATHPAAAYYPSYPGTAQPVAIRTAVHAASVDSSTATTATTTRPAAAGGTTATAAYPTMEPATVDGDADAYAAFPVADYPPTPDATADPSRSVADTAEYPVAAETETPAAAGAVSPAAATPTAAAYPAAAVYPVGAAYPSGTTAAGTGPAAAPAAAAARTALPPTTAATATTPAAAPAAAAARTGLPPTTATTAGKTTATTTGARPAALLIAIGAADPGGTAAGAGGSTRFPLSGIATAGGVLGATPVSAPGVSRAPSVMQQSRDGAPAETVLAQGGL